MSQFGGLFAHAQSFPSNLPRIPTPALRLARNSCRGVFNWLDARDLAIWANNKTEAGFSPGNRIDVSPEQQKEKCVFARPRVGELNPSWSCFIPRGGRDCGLQTKWGRLVYQCTCFCGVFLPSTCSPSRLFICKFLVRFWNLFLLKKNSAGLHRVAGCLDQTVALFTKCTWFTYKVRFWFWFLGCFFKMHFTPVNHRE